MNDELRSNINYNIHSNVEFRKFLVELYEETFNRIKVEPKAQIWALGIAKCINDIDEELSEFRSMI